MSEQDIGRRQLILSSAVGALALTPSCTAQADMTFSNFRFPATGAPTARTMPDRLDDVVNVKDWGATGNGRTDDTAAIQAALDHAQNTGFDSSTRGSYVYFPSGKYHITAPLYVVYPEGPKIIGAGKFSAVIDGNFEGFLLTLVGTPASNLSITAITNSGGKIRITMSVSFIYGGDIAPNVPIYVISGVTGTSGLSAATNGTWRFSNVVANASAQTVSATLVGSRFPAGGTYSGGGVVNNTASAGTQAASLNIENMCFNNAFQQVNSGGIRIGYDPYIGAIRNCRFSCYVGIDAASSFMGGGNFGFGIYDCYFNSGAVSGMADRSNTGGASGYTGFPPGSTGVYLGQGALVNCRAQGFDVGFAMSRGGGSSCINCSAEVCNTGLYVGLSNGDGDDNIRGAFVNSFQTEAVNYGIRLKNVTGGLIAGCVITAPTVSAVADAMGTFHWDGVNRAIVTTDNPHNLGSAGTTFKLNIGRANSAWFQPGNIFNILATVDDATHFHYTLTTNPGGDLHQAWGLSPIAAISVTGSCQYVTFTGNYVAQFGGQGWGYSLDLSGNAQASNNIFECCDCSGGITYPSSAYKAGWKFRQVGAIYVGDPEVAMAMKFADLPNGKMSGTAGTNTQQGPWEGQEYTIVDCPINPFPATGTAFGAVVSSGTTTSPFHAKLRYCGSPLAWRIVG